MPNDKNIEFSANFTDRDFIQGNWKRITENHVVNIRQLCFSSLFTLETFSFYFLTANIFPNTIHNNACVETYVLQAAY